MTQSRLNNVMVMHIHIDLTDFINHLQALNEFSSANEDKSRRFGRFWNKLCYNHMLGWFCKLRSFCTKYSLDAEVKGSIQFRVPRIHCYLVPECEAWGCYGNGFKWLWINWIPTTEASNLSRLYIATKSALKQATNELTHSLNFDDSSWMVSSFCTSVQWTISGCRETCETNTENG